MLSLTKHAYTCFSIVDSGSSKCLDVPVQVEQTSPFTAARVSIHFGLRATALCIWNFCAVWQKKKSIAFGCKLWISYGNLGCKIVTGAVAIADGIVALKRLLVITAFTDQHTSVSNHPKTVSCNKQYYTVWRIIFITDRHNETENSVPKAETCRKQQIA